MYSVLLMTKIFEKEKISEGIQIWGRDEKHSSANVNIWLLQLYVSKSSYEKNITEFEKY